MSWWTRLRSADGMAGRTPPPYRPEWGPVYAVVPELRLIVTVLVPLSLVAVVVLVRAGGRPALAGLAALVLLVPLSPRLQRRLAPGGVRVRALPDAPRVEPRHRRRGAVLATFVGLDLFYAAVAAYGEHGDADVGAHIRDAGLVVGLGGIVLGQVSQLRLLRRLEAATGGRVVRLQHRPPGHRSARGYYLLGAAATAATAVEELRPTAGGRPATPYARPGR